MLGSEAIQSAMRDGQIIITPYNVKQLGSNSYDLRAGTWLCRQKDPYQVAAEGHCFIDSRDQPTAILDLSEKIDGEVLWSKPENVEGGTIRLAPGELILMQTAERVGCYGDIIGEMSSRSSMMRCGIAVCVDAGLGDVGFDGHWTMEVFNHTRIHIQFRPGDRIAQMKFHRVEGLGITYAQKGGTYGHANDEYRPEDMIPRSSMR